MQTPVLLRSDWRSLRRISTSGTSNQPSQVRLVCFPWCGGGASIFRRLGPGLAQHIELLAVQLPGREDRFRENRLLRMEHIIEHVIEDFATLRDRPLVFFGHSMGALVAYEMALALRSKFGREPDALIVSGHGSPCSRSLSDCAWHTADEAAFVANIQQLGGTPSDILKDPGMMQTLIPVLRADYEVLDTYEHREAAPLNCPLSCPIIACAGESDKEVTIESMSVWQKYSTGPYELHWFCGDHFYFCTRPRTLTRRLEEWIERIVYEHEREHERQPVMG